MELLFILFIIGCIFGFHIPFIIVVGVFLLCWFINLLNAFITWIERVWN